jgi:dihydroanticapsin dehydrogenase
MRRNIENLEYYHLVNSSKTHILSRAHKHCGGTTTDIHSLMGCMFGYQKNIISEIEKLAELVRNNITNKTIMITGGSSGIGYAYSTALLNLGNRIVIVSKETAIDKARELADTYPEFAENVKGVIGDVRNRISMENAFNEASAFSPTGILDIIILNAGIDAPIFEAENIIQTNLMGVIYGIELYVKQITNNLTTPADPTKDYQIIVTGSVASFIPVDMNLSPGYDSSKAGIAQYVRGMRPFAVRYNYRINAVCPAGMVRTRLTQPFMDTPEKLASVTAYQNAEGRGGIMEPEQLVPGLLEVLSLPSYNGDIIAVQPNLGYPFRLEERDPANSYLIYGIYDERDSPATKEYIDYVINMYMTPPSA